MNFKLFFIITMFLSVCYTANGKTDISKSDTLSMDFNGRHVDIEVSYPFKSKVDGIVLWCDGGQRNTFIPHVGKKYEDVEATLRGAVLYAGYASVEYIGGCGTIQKNGLVYHDDDPETQTQIMQKVIERIHQEKSLSNKKTMIFAFDKGCMAAALLYPKMKDDISKILLVSPMIDNSLATIKRMRVKSAMAERVKYFVDKGERERVDSMNAASDLDADYSSDILGRLQYERQHVEPLDSIVKNCHTMDTAYVAVKNYLMEKWRQEPLSVHNYWQGKAESYCCFFGRSATPGRVKMLMTDMDKLYGNIQCSVKVIYGAKDTKLDATTSMRMMRDTQWPVKDIGDKNDAKQEADSNIRLMSEALKGKENTAVDIQIWENFGHDLHRTDRGDVNPIDIQNIIKWLD